MIVPVLHINSPLWFQPRRGDSVRLTIEHSNRLCSPCSIAVYSHVGEKLGYVASSFRHSPALQASIEFNSVNAYIWLADRTYLLVEVIDGNSERRTGFQYCWESNN
jgi:hypothetical protein